MLLLPGTGGAPSNGLALGALAARLGYHVIGLMYPDDLAVVEACASDPAPNCMEAMRDEIIEGLDRSLHVAVDAVNSIDGRCSALLTYLTVTSRPKGGMRS